MERQSPAPRPKSTIIERMAIQMSGVVEIFRSLVRKEKGPEIPNPNVDIAQESIQPKQEDQVPTFDEPTSKTNRPSIKKRSLDRRRQAAAERAIQRAAESVAEVPEVVATERTARAERQPTQQGPEQQNKDAFKVALSRAFPGISEQVLETAQSRGGFIFVDQKTQSVIGAQLKPVIVRGNVTGWTVELTLAASLSPEQIEDIENRYTNSSKPQIRLDLGDMKVIMRDGLNVTAAAKRRSDLTDGLLFQAEQARAQAIRKIRSEQKGVPSSAPASQLSVESPTASVEPVTAAKPDAASTSPIATETSAVKPDVPKYIERPVKEKPVISPEEAARKILDAAQDAGQFLVDGKLVQLTVGQADRDYVDISIDGSAKRFNLDLGDAPPETIKMIVDMEQQLKAARDSITAIAASTTGAGTDRLQKRVRAQTQQLEPITQAYRVRLAREAIKVAPKVSRPPVTPITRNPAVTIKK